MLGGESPGVCLLGAQLIAMKMKGHCPYPQFQANSASDKEQGSQNKKCPLLQVDKRKEMELGNLTFTNCK